MAAERCKRVDTGLDGQLRGLDALWPVKQKALTGSVQPKSVRSRVERSEFRVIEHFDAPDFPIVQASAMPAGTEFGLRGQDGREFIYWHFSLPFPNKRR